MACGIFLSAYILRIVGNVEYGLYQTISSFANYLVLLEFGTGTAMTRNLSVCRNRQGTKEEINRNIGTIWVITVLLSLVIIVVSVIFYLGIPRIYSRSLTGEQIRYARKIFVFITVYLLASFYLQTINGAILGYEQYVFSSAVTLVRTVSRTVLLISVLWVRRQAVLIAVVDMSLSVIILAISYLYCIQRLKIRFRVGCFDKRIFMETCPLCLAIFLQVVINQANNNVDKTLIGIKMNPESVALYSVGMYIYSIFSSLTTIPISMYAPEVARNVVKGLKGKELTDTLIPPSRLIVLVGGTVLFGFISAGKPFISIIYGKDYLAAWWIAVIIMIPMFVNMSNGVLVDVLDVLNKRISRSLILFATTILNIVLTFFFLDWYGIIGAAVATMIATILGQILFMNIYYQFRTGIHILYMFANIYRGILPYQVLGAVFGYVFSGLFDNLYLAFFTGGTVYCLLFFSMFWLFGADQEEKSRLRKMIHRG